MAGHLSTALQAVQHRGQDSCGFFTFAGDHFPGHRGLGLVKDVFDQKKLERLTGNVGIGHVRYLSIGKGVLAAPQYLKDASAIGGLDPATQLAMEDAWAKDLRIDSLTFLSVPVMNATFPKSRCAACFDGTYPLPIPDGRRESIANDRICNRPST